MTTVTRNELSRAMRSGQEVSYRGASEQGGGMVRLYTGIVTDFAVADVNGRTMWEVAIVNTDCPTMGGVVLLGFARD